MNCKKCGKEKRTKSKLCANCRKLEVKLYNRNYYLKTHGSQAELKKRQLIAEEKKKERENQPCSVDGCPNKARTRGLCRHHYDVDYYHRVIKPRDKDARNQAAQAYYRKRKAKRAKIYKRNPILKQETTKSAYTFHDIQSASPEKLLKIFKKIKNRDAIYAG